MTPVAQDALPQDAETLREMLLKVARERDEALRSAETFRGELATTKAELAIALHKLRLQVRALFGPRTERLTNEQLPLFMKSAEEAKAKAAAEDASNSDEIVVPAHIRKRRSGGDRSPLPESLPREVVEHPLDEAQRFCSCCGEERIIVAWSAREVPEHVPAQLKVIVHRRPVAVCGSCRSTVAPPLVGSTLPIPKPIAAPGLLASVVVGKYCDHLPLYRLEGILPRHGVRISRQTLCGWLEPLMELVSPLTGLMRREVLLSYVTQTDDTPVTTLGVREGGVTWRFWCYLGDAAHRFAVFDFSTDRKGQRPQKWLKEFKGELQSDAYAGYDALHRANGGLAVAVACLADGRRNFHESRDLSPEFCGKVLSSIRRLYTVESEAKRNKLDHAQRLALRRERSLAEHDALFALLEANRQRHLPKSPVRQAVEYMLTRRRAFTEYLEDGALEIDNNACERSGRARSGGRTGSSHSLTGRARVAANALRRSSRCWFRHGCTTSSHGRGSATCSTEWPGFAPQATTATPPCARCSRGTGSQSTRTSACRTGAERDFCQGRGGDVDSWTLTRYELIEPLGAECPGLMAGQKDSRADTQLRREVTRRHRSTARRRSRLL